MAPRVETGEYRRGSCIGVQGRTKGLNKAPFEFSVHSLGCSRRPHSNAPTFTSFLVSPLWTDTARLNGSQVSHSGQLSVKGAQARRSPNLSEQKQNVPEESQENRKAIVKV